MATVAANRESQIDYEMKQIGGAVLAHYRKLRRRGESASMAAMIATRKTPQLKNTDTQFCKRERDRMQDIPEKQRDDIVAIARRAGINTTGKTYNGQLGTYSDPAAWIGDTHDVRKVAMAKGLDVQGMVNVKAAVPLNPERKPGVAPDICDRMITERAKHDKQFAKKIATSPKARKAAADEIVAKHAPKRKK
jgi:hypothetical protein